MSMPVLARSIERASRQVMIHELTLLQRFGRRTGVASPRQQGHLYSYTGRSHRRAAWLRCPPEGAPTYPGGLFQPCPVGPAGSARGLGRLATVLAGCSVPDLLLDGLPRLDLDGADAAAISQGRAVQAVIHSTPRNRRAGAVVRLRRWYSWDLVRFSLNRVKSIPKRLVSSDQRAGPSR